MKGILFITLVVLIALTTIPVAGQQAASGTISIVGEVKNPGQYPFKDGYTVQAAIMDAGGFTEKGDTTRAIVLHSNKKSEQVTFSDTGTPAVVLVGDTIIARKMISISVEGKVKKPGRYDYFSGMTLLQAFAAAGGADNGANLVDCCLDCKGKLKPINLQALLDSKDMAGNIEMQPGDVLYIPESIVIVMGQVVTPGRYILTDGKETRLLDMIKNAGGFTATADMKKAVLSRIVGSSRKKQRVDLARADAYNNPVVQKGDVVEVPGLVAPVAKKPLISLTDLQTIALTLFYYKQFTK